MDYKCEKPKLFQPRLFKILYVSKRFAAKSSDRPRSSQIHINVNYLKLQQQYSYTPVQIASLKKTISPARLSTYQIASGGNTVDALRLYHWNMALGQSLHIPIQSLEVSLRNTISSTINSLFGQNWYVQARFKTILTSWAKSTLNDAVNKANKESRRKRKPITEGDVIANLSFGFWGELLASRYDKHLWNKKLNIAFPHLPATKNSQDIYNPVHKIIKLRNRISHHEPIIKRGLLPIYNSMLDVIGWICLDTRDWVEHHCDFDAVHSNPP